MNFLELCKKVASDAGISTTNPTSVKNQVGIIYKVVGWVQEADLFIQNEKKQWAFLWDRSHFMLTQDRSVYAPGDLTIENTDALEHQQVDAITVNGKALTHLTWSAYLRDVERNSNPQSPSNPKLFAVSPHGSVYFYPTPSLSVEAQVDYFETPIAMVENTDTSMIPKKYRNIIVHKALMLYAESEGDAEIYTMAERRYNEIYDQLVDSYIATTSIGGNVL